MMAPVGARKNGPTGRCWFKHFKPKFPILSDQGESVPSDSSTSSSSDGDSGRCWWGCALLDHGAHQDVGQEMT